MTRRDVRAALAGAAVAAVLGGGAAWAAIPDASGVINGCYQKIVGHLRVVDPGTGDCRPSEVAITWNQARGQRRAGRARRSRPGRGRRPRRRQRHRRPGACGRELRDGWSQGHRGKRRHVRL